MSLTVVITRDVEDRYRGLLASAMLEASAGVYFSNGLSARARDKLWGIVSDWHGQLTRGSLTMLFADSSSDGGVSVRSVGLPARRPVRLDGALLMHRVNE
jgi:CRISPR-associated protein Cas2